MTTKQKLSVWIFQKRKSIAEFVNPASPPIPRPGNHGEIELSVTVMVQDIFPNYCKSVRAQIVSTITDYLVSGGIEEHKPETYKDWVENPKDWTV